MQKSYVLLITVPVTIPYLSDPMASLFICPAASLEVQPIRAMARSFKASVLCIHEGLWEYVFWKFSANTLHFTSLLFQATTKPGRPSGLGRSYTLTSVYLVFFSAHLLFFSLLISLSVFIPFSARILFEANSIKPHSNWLSTVDSHNWKVQLQVRLQNQLI